MSGKVILRLFLALLLTLVAAYYQRKTGPTYPIKGERTWQGLEIKYTFERSHGGAGDQLVSITLADTAVNAMLIYRRLKSEDPWIGMVMKKGDQGQYSASLPHQPPAGKIEYFILLNKQALSTVLPENNSVVTRFKGDVPPAILLPHILLMFLAMLLSNAAGLEALVNGQLLNKFAFWAVAGLFLGGMVLGPVVQKYAFGTFWSGIPFGYDLTDNKTLLAMLVWLIALWKGWSSRVRRTLIIAAAIILVLVFSIPHSVMGSELNYQTAKIESGK
jgi:hypothetical protein